MINGLNLNYHNYDRESDIHFIDYSGVIDLDEGIARIEYLDKYFSTHKQSMLPFKILMDTRTYVEHSPETHGELAKVSRKKFQEKYDVLLAVLNSEHSVILSDQEGWFTSETEAIDWLMKK